MSDHTVDHMKGKAKETIGDITGDKGLQVEGKLEQAVASAKDQMDKAKDAIENAVNPKDAIDSEDASPKQ